MGDNEDQRVENWTELENIKESEEYNGYKEIYMKLRNGWMSSRSDNTHGNKTVNQKIGVKS